MEGIPLRMARRGDLPSLHVLWQALLAEHARLDPRLCVHPGAGTWLAAHLAEALGDPQRVLLVAEEGGRRVVGFVSARLLPEVPGEPREAEVGDCFVVPPRRRRGIARRLVQRALDLLQERGAQHARLQVAVRNPDALAFWRGLGFEPVETLLQRPA
ncbi:MAG: N-acetyltransferase family protein [Planctomycetia bacterium]